MQDRRSTSLNQFIAALKHYDIYQEDDFDMFNEVINRQIEKDRNIDKFI